MKLIHATQAAALLAVLSVASLRAEKPDWTNPPDQFATLEAAKSWVQRNKGWGYPQTALFTYNSIHLFVSWNGPYSGPALTYAYTYIQEKNSPAWRKFSVLTFDQPHLPAYVYIDSVTRTLVFVGYDQKIIKRVDLASAWGRVPPN